ncbi:hypothetical protein AERO8C_20323 [Aeromonas veronii]|uniref:Uncharacterized protein n=1 Tax=Aeromonas veronii TaxID=654 RepID=A0A653L0N6_AERVE|nr:hypothetical protein AERO8C_20323 [Aeromonas veronii]
MTAPFYYRYRAKCPRSFVDSPHTP